MLRAAETIVRTDPGRHRSNNEDASFVRAPVFALADGMGGAQSGEVASAIVAQTFERGLPDDGTPEDRLAVAVQKANREIYDRSASETENAGMGTTVTAAYLADDAVAVAHVGDSRAYLFRDGELQLLTADHSLVGELEREGKLTEDEAFEHPQRSIITRVLGHVPVVEIDTWTYPLRPDDVVLLCSDGLTDMLREREVAAILAQSPNLSATADNLIDAANAAGGRDNITVVLFRAEEVGATADGDHTQTLAAVDASSAGGGLAGPPPAPAPSFDKPKVPLARLQGWTPKSGARTHPHLPGHREFTGRARVSAAIFAICSVIFLVGGGGYLATRQLYFLGTNGQGTVVVYRGLPYVMPFGVPMYETYYVSGVPASTIPAARRATLLNHSMLDENKAIKLINDLELGKIVG